MTTLKIEFDNDKAARHFALWLSESGEQQYWDWMEYREAEEKGPITAGFRYHPENEQYAENDKRRYGPFLKDWTIRARCGRMDDDSI